MNIKLILNAIKSIGVDTGRSAIQYSLYRDIHDWNAPKHQIIDSGQESDGVISRQITTDGAVIQYRNKTLSINFLSDNLVRITWEPGKLPIPYTIVRNEWEKIEINQAQTENGLILSSKALVLFIGDDGGIQYNSPSGTSLRKDYPPQVIRGSWRLTTRLRDDEHIYGFGERAAPFNLVGGSYRTWNTDPGGSYSSGNDPLYICTPVLLALGSTGTYLVYFENTYPATLDLHSLSTITYSGGALRYYFIIGTPEELLEKYTELTGRPAMPPRWVFGYHQSRWGYHSESEIREVVSGFDSHQLPISAIHLDIDYMDGYRVFTADKERFPDLNKLSADLKERNINLVTIIDPGVKKDHSYPIYKNGLQSDVFCKSTNDKILHGVVWPGWAAYPDFTDPKVRQWWGKQYFYYLDAGISGFWHDMNEPVSFCAWGENTIPLTTKHNLDGNFGNHLEAHNLYGLLMNKAAYEALTTINPDKRAWLISRSGWAGLQHYAWNWTGDVASTWDALRQTLITLMGLSLSGHFFSGSDIGGFSGNPSAELYLRWFQLSTFFPFCRTHSAIGTNRREPWIYGEPYTTIIRQFLLLRYQLIPYFYTLAWKSHKRGIPMIRPLFWNHPDRDSSWNIDDQFYLGEDILIAPILQPDCDTRSIVLPPGVWYFMGDDTCVIGPTTVKVPVTLEHIPIMIRGGSIIPREVNGDLGLHVYPKDFHASGILYTDAGDGYGNWRVDEFNCAIENGDLNISRQVKGDYPFPYQNMFMVVHGHRVKRAWMNDKEIELRYA
jgi:alpha-glucosidase